MLKSELLDRVDKTLALQGRARATRKVYRIHLESLLRWGLWKHGKWTHPLKLGREGVQHWLSDLATIKHVSPSTQNVALQAALLLHKV